MDDLTIYKERFEALDKDGNGNVRVEDILKAWEEYLKSMSNGVDANGNATIDFDVYCQFNTLQMLPRDINEPPSPTKLSSEENDGEKAMFLEAFRAVDPDQTGFATVAELTDVIYELSEGVNEKNQITGWIRDFGVTSDDARVNYEEFVDFLIAKFQAPNSLDDV